MKRELFALSMGLVLGIPLVAWSGGDLCSHRQEHYDHLELELTSLAVDGTARAVTAPPGLSLDSASPFVGDDAAFVGVLPDPTMVTLRRQTHVRRRP